MVKKLFLVFLTFVFTVNVFGQSEIQKELEASKEKYKTYSGNIHQAIEIRDRWWRERTYLAGFIGNKMLKKIFLDADNTYRKIEDLNELDTLLELIETEKAMTHYTSYGYVALGRLWREVSSYRNNVEKSIKKEEPKEEVVETKTKSKSKKVSDDMYF